MKQYFIVLVLACVSAFAQPLDPKIDYRLSTGVVRDPDGTIHRSSSVISAFKRQWACPSTGLHSGNCPGWAVDHVIPLACGGFDAVWNMQWLPDEIKSQKGEFSKDRFERRIYGGNDMSKGCP